MFIADVSLGNESVVIAAITAVFGALVAAIVYLFKKGEADQVKTIAHYEAENGRVIATYERQRTLDLADSKSWQEMASLAVENIEQVANKVRKANHEEPIKPLVPVIPEHASPTTEQQRATAEIQTVRARLVAATLALGLVARLVTRDATPEEEAENKMEKSA